MTAVAPPFWMTAPAPPPMAAGEVHVWRIGLSGAEAGNLLDRLSAEERAMAARFVYPADRARYVLAHARLREILGRYLGADRLLVPFGKGPNGKPALGESAVRFNLSHSRDLALVAVARETEVGVDLEAIDPAVEVESIAGNFFSRAEQTALLALAPDRRAAGFFHLWAQKEAYLKGRGDGVVLGLDHFDMEADPGLEARLRADRRDPAAVGQWWMATLDPGPEYRAALAVLHPAPVVRGFQWAF